MQKRGRSGGGKETWGERRERGDRLVSCREGKGEAQGDEGGGSHRRKDKQSQGLRGHHPGARRDPRGPGTLLSATLCPLHLPWTLGHLLTSPGLRGERTSRPASTLPSGPTSCLSSRSGEPHLAWGWFSPAQCPLGNLEVGGPAGAGFREPASSCSWRQGHRRRAARHALSCVPPGGALGCFLNI